MTADTASRVIADAREICAVPAPPFGEQPRGELVARMLTDAGAAVERDAVGNVIGRLGRRDDPEPVIFAAHLDTVFAAGTEITFTERDGRLSAPGIGDNSLGVAALVQLARGLSGRQLSRGVLLAATVGEEGLGDLRGSKALVAENPCGAFVAIEGQMLDSVKTAAVGSLRYRLQICGPGGHPWGDRHRPSAIHELLTCLAAGVAAAGDEQVVVNVGVIEGGTVINAIASRASAEVELRCEDGERLLQAATTLRDAVAVQNPALSLEVVELGYRPGGSVSGDHPLVDAARRARERVGLPRAKENASSTDANAAHGRGIPAITVGVTTGGNAHRLDEYIDLAPVSSGVAWLDELAKTLTE